MHRISRFISPEVVAYCDGCWCRCRRRRRNEVRVASFLDWSNCIPEAYNLPLGGDGRLVLLPYSCHQAVRALHT